MTWLVGIWGSGLVDMCSLAVAAAAAAKFVAQIYSGTGAPRKCRLLVPFLCPALYPS